MLSRKDRQYIGELWENWRPLAAAFVGLGTGMSMISFVTSVLAPLLIRDNGWSMADFALVTMFSSINILVIPLVGRMADVLGVRRTALIGMAMMPVGFMAFSLMSGSLVQYIVIFVIHAAIGMTTTATVFTRLIVQAFNRSRGLALAIAVSGPAVVGAIGAPLLNNYAEQYGWRSSYQALATFSVLAAIVTIALIPRENDEATAAKQLRSRPGMTRSDYSMIFCSKAFWILAVAVFLCNLPQVIVLSQLKLLLMANGVSGEGASIMFTALSVGMLAGRFLTGAALDRYNPFVVSTVTLCLPSVGLFLFASPLDSQSVLMIATFALGFAFGAEGDALAYLVSRLFDLRIYSTVLGLVMGVLSGSASVGAIILSITFRHGESFSPFLHIAGSAVLIGAMLILLLRRTLQGAQTVAQT